MAVGLRPARALQAHLPGLRHFRSDPPYLPELKSCLQQLLAGRERVQAATDLQDWAKAQLTRATTRSPSCGSQSAASRPTSASSPRTTRP
jgi:hypothetical protein